MQRIFLVEDDHAIVHALSEYLLSEGFEVFSATTQRAALEQLSAGSVRADLLLVDLSLPDGNGFVVCEEAKKKGLPVIFLTASDDERNIIRGYDMDADDYIAKPFRPRELVSRIHNVLRRHGKVHSLVALGKICVDTEKGEVTRDGHPVSLSALEYRLLMLFINNRGILLSRSRLLEDIWDVGGDFVNDNTLTVYIKRLREKIEEDPQQPILIKTVRGLGYRMD